MQREQQKKLEQTVQEMKQEETTAKKKQQELTARLFLDSFVGGSLREGRERVYFQVTERIKRQENSAYHWTQRYLELTKRLGEVAVSTV